MILSKSILHSHRTILTVLKYHQIVWTSSFHHLRPITSKKLVTVNSVLVPEFCSVLSRFESSKASQGKDVILQVLSEAPSTKTHTEENVSSKVIDNLPDIPVPGTADALSEIIAETAVPLNKLGEATLESIGLGSLFSPVGWVQRILEFIHVTFDIPWWGSIAICVVIARSLMFPLVIQHQRNSTILHNVMPEMTALQMKMQNAKVYGNNVEMMKIGQELATFMQKNKVKPFSTMIMPMVQAPVFVSFFWALKKMAAAPVESFKDGGMLWFVDLTVCDQYYALPAITCLTLLLTLELGADFSKIPTASLTGRYMPYVIRVVPFVVFPIIMNFPSAICVYWASTNLISLCQVAFLKIPKVRTYFQIADKKIDVKVEMKKTRKGLITDFKSSMGNMKIAKEIQERERLDAANFKRAGRQPPAKTFKYNPVVTSQAVQAKKQ